MVIDGVNGLLFEPDSAGELAACLRRLNSQSGLLGELAANCRRSAARFYDEDARTTAEEEVFAQVIARMLPEEERTAI
jgi:glycosyltransferase involved in cell wall biosynthesis